MNRHLHLFNPENDLALAVNSNNYTPPAAALRLGHDGASLPLWYGSAGDVAIIKDADYGWIEHTKEVFGIETSVYTGAEDFESCLPWGWSIYARRQFELLGVTTDRLPDDMTLQRYRTLSHRRLTIDVSHALSLMLPYALPPCPIETDSEKEVERRLKNSEHIFLKSPWSSSGRGVLDSSTEPIHQLLRQTRGVIQRQGSIMVETALDRIQDFAMLFNATSEKVEFTGYSMFFNDNHDAYSGNLLADDKHMEKLLTDYVLESHLKATVQSVTEVLNDLLRGKYTGPLGVDMMIYRDNGMPCIAPCIEINLRNTMGIVAHEWTRRYLAEGSTGVMRIERIEPSKPCREKYLTDNRRLVEGQLCLTSPNAKSFRIVVEARRNN